MLTIFPKRMKELLKPLPKNDYVITVKGNHKNLDQRIQDLSNSSKPESCFLEQDNSHGRKISRKIEVFKVRKNERQGFENLRRVIKVERRGSRGDKTYEETAYYISSLTESAQVFAKIIRGHWKIENQLHPTFRTLNCHRSKKLLK